MSFYNISNHASTRWSTDQREATKTQTIIDLPFPNIPPHASLEEVESMAMEFATQVPTSAKAMIAGEPTFSAALVKALQEKGCLCLVACSERNVVENEDGSKTVKFHFIQFREWPSH